MDDKINVFIDTNILIDYLARRERFFEAAALVVQLGQRKKCHLLVSSLSFATTSFILQAHYKFKTETILHKFSLFVHLCHVTPVDSLTIYESLNSSFHDFEDAMQYFSAMRAEADVIITRNKLDFSEAEIPVYEPQEFLDALSSETH